MRLRHTLLVALVVLVSTSALIASTTDHGSHQSQPIWWFMSATLIIAPAIAWMSSRYLIRRNGQPEPVFSILQQFSFFLLAGVIVSQLWVHGDFESYTSTMHSPLFQGVSGMEINVHFLVNEVFMVLFFGIATKELTEAFLKKGGTLRGSKGLLPIIGCIGGVIGPAIIYLLIAEPDMRHAWAVPCATDIAFAWLGARAIWGSKHPAVTFLLALAIVDDFIGMGIIAIFYPQGAVNPIGYALLAGGIATAAFFNWMSHSNRFFRSWIIYLLPGVLSWYGLHEAGLHSALALVFVVPFMPMGRRDEGLFARGESEHQHDTLNRYEHSTKPIVDVGLFYFGLANAGVAWLGTTVWDQNSWAVFAGLGLGKTLFITLFTWLGFHLLRQLPALTKLSLPSNAFGALRWIDLPILGIVAAMGFTVALFVADAAGGEPALKLGALASFAYLVIGVGLGKLTQRTGHRNNE